MIGNWNIDPAEGGKISAADLRQLMDVVYSLSMASAAPPLFIERTPGGIIFRIATEEIAASSGGYATMQDEGSSLTARTTLNFTGPRVVAADNGGSTRTDVSVTVALSTKTGNFSASSTVETVYLCDLATAGANITATLPAASAATGGLLLTFKIIANGTDNAYTVTIARAGADTIDGATSVIIYGTGDSVTIISDGASTWKIVSDTRQPHNCVVYNNTTQSITIPANTLTTINWSTDLYDAFGLHSTSSNTSRLTIRRAGKYRIKANWSWSNNATGVRHIEIYANGSTTQIANCMVSFFAVGFSNPLHEVSGEFSAAAGDYFELRAKQNSGGNLVMTGSNASTFSATWIGP